MYYSLDAIDGGAARLIDDEETLLWVPVTALPPEAVETDVLEWRDGAWSIALEETARRKDYAAQLLRELLGH